MPKSLILHIGAPKTGSTALQRHLKINSKKLKKNGIGVPGDFCPRKSLNSRLLAEMVAPRQDYLLRHQVDQVQRQEQISRAIKGFEEFVGGTNHDRYVLSSEHLWRNVQAPEEIRELREFLYRYFDSITLFVSLVAVGELTPKAWQQSARSDGKALLHQFAEFHLTGTRTRFTEGVIKWDSVFAPDGFKVTFPGLPNHEKDIRRVFFSQVLGIAIPDYPNYSWEKAARNSGVSSLQAGSAVMMNRILPHYGPSVGARVNQAQKKLLLRSAIPFLPRPQLRGMQAFLASKLWETERSGLLALFGPGEHP